MGHGPVIKNPLPLALFPAGLALGVGPLDSHDGLGGSPS